MKQINFKPGYHEWNVFVNDKVFYSFGDGIGEMINDNTSFLDFEYIVDEYIEAMQEELEENEREILEEKYLPELKTKMLDAWSDYLLVVA